MRRPATAGNVASPSTLWRWLCLPSTALLLAALLGCVTPVPRSGAAIAPTAQVASPSPVASPTPIPTPTPAPTATARPVPTPAPTAEPTETPAPTPPPATPATPPSGAGAPQGPLLAVFAPEDGTVVRGGSVVVYGHTEPGARVSISGLEAGVDSLGGFRAEVSLEKGDNLLEIVAATENGNRTQVSRRVTALDLPFLLVISEPENESVVSEPNLTLSGRTDPNAIVSIDGRSVPVDRFGYFSTTMVLVEGPNIMDVVATNDDGETLSKVVALIYRPDSEQP